jgi:RNA polymerase-binding transcription factor
MQPKGTKRNEERLRVLREILNHERNVTLARVREYRRIQEDEALPPPSDELDVARSLADVETHASLIERAEDRLRAIDFAFNRLEQGRYGICALCGDEIPIERLKALPFTVFCVDCQNKRSRAVRLGEGRIEEPFARQWTIPEEMQESTETARDEMVRLPEEELVVRGERPFGPEQGELASPPRARARRGRKRKQGG